MANEAVGGRRVVYTGVCILVTGMVVTDRVNNAWVRIVYMVSMSCQWISVLLLLMNRRIAVNYFKDYAWMIFDSVRPNPIITSISSPRRCLGVDKHDLV
jgi:hypothetical protein